MSNHPEYYEASNFSKNMACSGLTEVESSIVKSTYEDDSVPKEKHVISLLRLSDFDTSFFTPLFRRISTRNYRVVLKTLLVFHRLSRDGPLHNIKALETKTQFFTQLCSYQSRESPVHARIIRLYASYWVEKISSYAVSGRSTERDSPADAKVWALALKLPDVLTLLPALQKQMDKLLLIDPGVPFIDPNIRYFFNLLLRDSMRLYNACNILMYHNLKNVENMERTQTAIFLQCCRNVVSIDERYITWHKTLNRIRLATESLPAFQKLPDSIFSLLETRLTDFDRDAGFSQGDGFRLAAGYAISSTKAQAAQSVESSKANFHNDTMASPTPSSLSTKTGYSNQKPVTNTGANGQKLLSVDEFTFDAFNDSEWSFDNNTQGHGTNNNDPFASPQVQQNNNNNNTNFNNNFSPSQFQPQPQPQPQQNNDPFAAFDAFNDAVPVQHTTQIKTTYTGTSSSSSPPNQTQNQINNMYSSPSVNSTNTNPNQQFNTGGSATNNTNQVVNTNKNNTGYQPQHRASTANPPPYDDDPFSGLVNNNTPYQQPAMVVMAPVYQQPTMYTQGYQSPTYQQPQQWNNNNNNQQQQQPTYNNNNNNQQQHPQQQQQPMYSNNNNNNNIQQQQPMYNNNNNNMNQNTNNNAFDLPF